MSKNPCIVPAVIAALSLVACGGGNDGGAEPALTPAGPSAEITSTNAEQIAASVVKAVYQGGDVGDFADVSGSFGASIGTKAETVFSKIGGIQVNRTKAMLADSQIGLFRAPIDPLTTACAVDGSTTLSGDLQNIETLTVNDVITLQFDECDDGVAVVDGTISMTVLSFEGDFAGGSVYFEVAIDITDFAVSQDGATTTANGDIRVEMDLPNTGPLSMRITTETLSVTDGSSTQSLEDFSFAQTIDPATGDYSLIVSGTLSGSTFAGTVAFSTTLALGGNGEDYAFTGELVISGRNDATIGVIALDAALVRLEVDLDGDDVVDEIIDTSWAELTAG